MNIYEGLKDKSIILKINEVFYDKIYEHPWMSHYFKDVDQDHITSQQTDFIIGSVGGPKVFGGRMPSTAHPHMMITEELYDLRTKLLVEAFDEVGVPDDLREAWLKIDQAFRAKIVKSSIDECKGRWTTDPIIDFSHFGPSKKKAG